VLLARRSGQSKAELLKALPPPPENNGSGWRLRAPRALDATTEFGASSRKASRKSGSAEKNLRMRPTAVTTPKRRRELDPPRATMARFGEAFPNKILQTNGCAGPRLPETQGINPAEVGKKYFGRPKPGVTTADSRCALIVASSSGLIQGPKRLSEHLGPIQSRRAIASAIMIVVTFVGAETISGMIDASTTCRPSTPRTAPFASTTALGSSALPMGTVEVGWE
jgi:hypothetical protein